MLYKKNAIENKIFASIIESNGVSVDVANNFDKFKILLKNNAYNLLMLDLKTQDLNIKELYSIIDSKPLTTKVVLFANNPDDSAYNSYREKFAEVVSSSINKLQLENLIKKYMGEN